MDKLQEVCRLTLSRQDRGLLLLPMTANWSDGYLEHGTLIAIGARREIGVSVHRAGDEHMNIYICAYCAKEFESEELDRYVQGRLDDNWPLSPEEIARFVCSPLCGSLMDEREDGQEDEDEQEHD